MNNVLSVVDECMKRANVPMTKIGPYTGKNKTYYSVMKSKDTVPKADTLANLLAVCGYGLYAIPIDENIPTSALQVVATIEPLSPQQAKEAELTSRKKELLRELERIDEELGD